MKTDLRILGGLLIEIEFEFDQSEVENKTLCEEWHIVSIGGVKCKSPPIWLYKRIAEKRGEFERIEADLMSIYNAKQKDLKCKRI